MTYFKEFLATQQAVVKLVFWMALCLQILSALQAEATEYVKPKTMYNNGRDWAPRSEALKASIIDACVQKYGASITTCTFEYGAEVWVASDNTWDKWHWSGTQVAKYTPPGYPQQTVTISGWFGYITHYCPTSGGWSLTPSVPICSRNNSSDPDCEQCKRNAPAAAQPPSVGNPIFPSTRVKQEVRVDYQNIKGTLRFIWTYRSDRNAWTHNYQSSVVDLNGTNSDELPSGACYTDIDGYCYPYAATGTNNDIALMRNNQRIRYFSSGSQFSTAADIKDRLNPMVAADGARTGWTVKNGDTEAQEVYDATGRLLTSTELNGQQTTYAYSDATTPIALAPKAGLLIRVTDAFGAALNFTYDAQSRLVTMTDPAGGLYTYTYNNTNLSAVIYPDGKKVSYLYNEAGLTSIAIPSALTGIVDENGTRYATFTYSGYTAASTEHAGGVDKYVLVPQTSTYISVTDPIGTVRNYSFYTSSLGIKRYTGGTQPGPGGNGTVSSSITYDANGNVASVTNFGGIKTTYVYDMARNLETSRTEAAGTTVARIVTTEWHPLWELRTRTAEPKRLTVNTYDDHGNLLTQTVHATTDADGSRGFSATLTGVSRTWTYTYDSLGQMLTVKGPRTDVNDLTSYRYDEQGNLTSATDALGHITTFSNYDPNGRVGKITDPNGLVTDLTYTPRGWLASRSVGGENTIFTYDGAGQLIELSLPDSSTISYTYDGAHRLTGIADSLGNRITYTLDAAGNRTLKTINDTNGVLARKTTTVYDALSLPKTQAGGGR